MQWESAGVCRHDSRVMVPFNTLPFPNLSHPTFFFSLLTPSVSVQFGNTALMIASNNGHLDKVRELIEAKANVNLQDKYGQSAYVIFHDRWWFSL